MKAEVFLKHGNEMKDIGRESGYHTALHHVKMWAIQHDLQNERLFDEIERLKASYKPIIATKEELDGIAW